MRLHSFASVGVAASVLIGLAGCPTATPPTIRPTTGPVTAPPMTMVVNISGPKDAVHPLESIVHLNIYIVDLPAGTVAADADFWKRVDEQAVGAATAERLAHDGIRCGVAPKSQGIFFSRYFDTEPGRVKRQTVEGIHAQTIAIDFTRPESSETIFYLNDHHDLIGRTYDDCVNGLSLAFGPTPRVPGSVRMTVCPVVRRTRRTIGYTATDGEVDQSKLVVESLYDASFTADVPGDGLLVISPGPQSGPVTSLGHAFLTRDDKAERREQVIVIVPTFLAVDGTTVVKTLGG
jgi:hypothetical protein